ncbi:TIGR02679 family protein [Ectobacillus ponti]|uniref:TIGR02679 family protein n=1 Tax=Ectobacillus ponti TaxID=2961894 RepID=A0AA42BQ08_9BACI|nr:TIGR02679 family protein [Ectobacillus ponti]MCP8969357.1 TIGR02679 family protein [Ectobacillus ponti]
MNDRLRVFRDEPGFMKLFLLFKEKYRSLGKMGGTVSLRSFTDSEIEAIAGFLAQSADMLRQKGKVSLSEFEKALQHTSFSDFSLLQLLEATTGEPILTKSEQERLLQEEEEAFLQRLYDAYPSGAWWWDRIRAKGVDVRWIWSLYREDAAALFDHLTACCEAFTKLPDAGKYEKLPLFAQRTTGNPHFFDSGTTAGKLLLHSLYIDQQHKGTQLARMPRTAEEIHELLGLYGIMKDDLWSFLSCRGFLAENEHGIHPVWEAAVKTNTVLNIPMKELVKLERIRPARGSTVWIVENSSVYSTIVDEVPDAPILCTHGQFRMASWVMLDFLVQSGCSLYYSGDFDPEGLVMAQRLKERYGEQVAFWQMDAKSYEAALSEEDISGRISKLEAMYAAELQEVVSLMREKKVAGYQEGLTARLCEDIKRSCRI